jgi:hypothetical protein
MDDETGFPAPSADIQTLAPNGINGSTGRSVLESVPLSEARKHALGLAADPEDLERLRNRADDARPKYSLKAGLSAQKLSEAGWGVIFHRDESDAVRNALKPLLDWRKSAEQAGAAYKEFSGQTAISPATTNSDSSAATRPDSDRPTPTTFPITCSSSADPRRSPTNSSTSSISSMRWAASASTIPRSTGSMPAT